MPVNYQRVLDETLKDIVKSGKTPRLLLHSCCGPCSSYVLDYLSRYFAITILYYNPNIYPESEFIKRAEVQEKLIAGMNFAIPVKLIVSDHRGTEFDNIAVGLEAAPEGGARCLKCFALRLEETAKAAKDGGYDYFTTTLSVSPHKNAEALNTIGGELAAEYDVKYLFADFKKKDGYKRSIELSEQYGLYRQNYCGCRYSMSHTKQESVEG